MENQLLKSIQHIHFSCYSLCKQAFGRYLPNAGNIGIFCRDEEEYELLTRIRERLTAPSDNPNQKYYRLLRPIVIPAKDDIPEIAYTWLYIRKPDLTPYGRHTGDVDFFLSDSEYTELKKSLIEDRTLSGAKIYNHPTQDMIELSDPKIDALGYVSTKSTTEKVRVRQ